MSSPQLRRLLRSLDGSAPELPTNNSKRLADYVRMAQQMYVQANAYFADQRYEEAYVFFLRLVKLRIGTMKRHNAASMSQYRREMLRTKEWAEVAMARLEEIKGILADILAGKHIEDTSEPAPECGPVSFPAHLVNDEAAPIEHDPAPPEPADSPTEKANAVQDKGGYPAVSMAAIASAVPPPDYTPVAEPVPPPASEDCAAADDHRASPALPRHPYAQMSVSLSDVHRAAMHESARGAQSTGIAGQAVPPPFQPTQPPQYPAPNQPQQQPQYQKQQQGQYQPQKQPPCPTGVPAPPPAYAPAPARGPDRSAPPPHPYGNALGAPARPSSILNEADQRIYLRECPGLRRLRVPKSLSSTFLATAEPNTYHGKDGIETLGVLCGKVHKDVLTITHVLLPPQVGKRDMCSMTDEGEVALFEFCASSDLLTLGWVHTHPCQACFLSSVDLHTHCGYQSMLPESVAIVLAPREKRVRMGVFRLTTPEGLELVQGCTQRGFHTHPEGVEIYALSPHVEFIDDAVELVDGRHQ